MNSPFAQLLLALQERIKTAVPAVNYIDQDVGQLSGKGRPPVQWPCVLIDFDNFRFKDLGEQVQTAQGTVVLRLGFAPHSPSNAATPEPYRQQAIGYYDVEWDLHRALHGWSPGADHGSLGRKSALTQVRTDAYRVRELRYKIAFDDRSTQRQLLYAPAALVVASDLEL